MEGGTEKERNVGVRQEKRECEEERKRQGRNGGQRQRWGGGRVERASVDTLRWQETPNLFDEHRPSLISGQLIKQ